MAEKTCELKENVILFFKGSHFTNANITDQIARQILKATPVLEKQFKAYPKGYAVETEEAKVSDAKKNLVKAKNEVKKIDKDLKAAVKSIQDEAVEVTDLEGKLDIAIAEWKAADDDKKEELREVAKEVEEALTKAMEGLEGRDEKISDLKAKLEEAEANVDKYESLLVKRDK